MEESNTNNSDAGTNTQATSTDMSPSPTIDTQSTDTIMPSATIPAGSEFASRSARPHTTGGIYDRIKTLPEQKTINHRKKIIIISCCASGVVLALIVFILFLTNSERILRQETEKCIANNSSLYDERTCLGMINLTPERVEYGLPYYSKKDIDILYDSAIQHAVNSSNYTDALQLSIDKAISLSASGYCDDALTIFDYDFADNANASEKSVFYSYGISIAKSCDNQDKESQIRNKYSEGLSYEDTQF